MFCRVANDAITGAARAPHHDPTPPACPGRPTPPASRADPLGVRRPARPARGGEHRMDQDRGRPAPRRRDHGIRSVRWPQPAPNRPLVVSCDHGGGPAPITGLQVRTGGPPMRSPDSSGAPGATPPAPPWRQSGSSATSGSPPPPNQAVQLTPLARQEPGRDRTGNPLRPCASTTTTRGTHPRQTDTRYVTLVGRTHIASAGSCRGASRSRRPPAAQLTASVRRPVKSH
jgi:hypothetical protein